MNIVREQRSENSSLLKITVTPADYGQEVEKALRDYRRKANILSLIHISEPTRQYS